MIETIGAQFIDSIEEAHTATHVIASDGRTKLRRTPKLMICICRVSRILSMEWLEQSAKEQRTLDTDGFLLLDDVLRIPMHLVDAKGNIVGVADP